MDARVALLAGLAMAARLRSEGFGTGRRRSPEEDGAEETGGVSVRQNNSLTAAIDQAEHTAEELIAETMDGGRLKHVVRPQASDPALALQKRIFPAPRQYRLYL